MKHSKGPWKLKTFSDFDGAIEIRAKDTRLVYLMEKPDFEDEANAKLIAAAPEMLETLELAVDKLMVAYATTKKLETSDHPSGAYLNELVMRLNEDLKTVIRKARGEL